MFKFKESIKNKLLLVMVFVVLVILSMLTYMSHQTSRTVLIESLGSKSLNILERLANDIDITKFESIDVVSGETDAYFEMTHVFNDFLNVSGAKYIYDVKPIPKVFYSYERIGNRNHVILSANTLGLTTIAEGVETKEQLDFLNARMCDAVQGYYRISQCQQRKWKSC